MDRNEMLTQLGLTNEELSNLLLKFRVFYASLTATEAAVVNRLIPRFRHVAALFGGNINKDDLKKLLSPPPSPPSPPPAPPPPGVQAPTGTAGAFGQNGVNQITNGDGDGNGG